MEKLDDSFLVDGKLLDEKFKEADGIISAGELDYREFSSQLVRKVIYLQLEFSKEGAAELYDKQKLENFRGLARQFLSQLKDSTLTETTQKQMSKEIKTLFPKLRPPTTAVTQQARKSGH